MSEQRPQALIRPMVSATAALDLVTRAVEVAAGMGLAVTVVVTDESGVLKAMTRMDGAALVSVQTAMSKAYAAAAIGMPPDDFYQAIKDDPAAVASFGTRPGLALIGGGLPIIVNKAVAGAVGGCRRDDGSRRP